MDKIKNKILEMYIGLYFLITLVATYREIREIFQHYFNVELGFIALIITFGSHALIIEKFKK